MVTRTRISAELSGLRAAARAGMIGPMPPRALAATARALRRYGPLGAATALPAHRFPRRTGLVDDRGSLTFGELDRRCNALANALLARGIGAGDTVGVLCRNHRGLLEAMSGAAKTGASVLFLNTDFAAPQLRDAVTREGVTAVLHDEEFAPVVDGLAMPRLTDADLDDLIGGADDAPPPAPPRPGSMVILTSGTSGRPKGAPRPQSRSMALPGGILSKVPFRGGEAMFVGPPLFHGLGLTSAILALGLGSTLVLRRRFDAAGVLDDLEAHRCASFVAVPVMLSRLLAVPGAEKRDLSGLKVVMTGGARLDPDLAERALAAFGPVLYNFYGSTEASCITIAGPDDLAAAPGCVGRPPAGTTVAILGDDDRPAAPGTTGRIFVDTPARFGGYTGGGGKEEVGGLMAVGDLGHVDADGRLHVDGRADDMIVSGGENVHPGEVEDLLAAHPGIEEAAVTGVPDAEFGQRLRAHVVRAAGAAVTEDDVKGHVAANLARHKVPRDVVFLDRLPRNPAGKVLKHALD
ncbi:AMP-binding protein [Actinomadura livida]|uniref:Fatty-acyl-CoA synthase n=1 Tax=Actinomadura livida TaxID=79909 RepID=A0A7W7IDQ6_9ACTN|nr:MULTISPECIES: AMP-binding protein [Actinomadura]MBB4775170.1 fatty-acyl-CoA synthase [Actinomadura catellatispora]GGT88335.1 acyl-CoA synthetase [Actinomadura livida]